MTATTSAFGPLTCPREKRRMALRQASRGSRWRCGLPTPTRALRDPADTRAVGRAAGNPTTREFHMTEVASIPRPGFGTDIVIEPDIKVRPLADELQFSITTDSVVATVTVTPRGSVRKILIAWGDGETSSLYSRPGLPPSEATVVDFDEEDDPLPAGTYRLSHAYPEPEDRMPTEYYAVLHVFDWSGGEQISIARVEITPRYKCTNYRTRVRLTGPCDPPTESTSEFDITLFLDGNDVHHWHWEPSNNFFGESQFFLLEDSQVSRELTVADGRFEVSFVFTETDLLLDNVLRLQADLSALNESETVSRNVYEAGGGESLFGGECDLIARYDREVSLIVPLPDSGHQVVYDA